MLCLITDPAIQLENFTENKRKLILSQYGDMRINAAYELKNIWFSLEDKKEFFIRPEIINSSLKLGLIPIKEINEAMIAIYFDMINFEYQINKEQGIAFNQLSTPKYFIQNLDELMINGLGHADFRDTFEKLY